ncbi:MAG: hypothetical protein VW362_12965 [Candidatus Nanopelagicales bacterium]
MRLAKNRAVAVSPWRLKPAKRRAMLARLRGLLKSPGPAAEYVVREPDRVTKIIGSGSLREGC